MTWIKASERLPEVHVPVVAKMKKQYRVYPMVGTFACASNGESVFLSYEGQIHLYIKDWRLDHLEWLDESEAQKGEKEADPCRNT